MSPRRFASRRTKGPRKHFKCSGGPFAGKTITLSVTGFCTLPLMVGRRSGLYRGGTWASA